jgi:hypothetical protein
MISWGPIGDPLLRRLLLARTPAIQQCHVSGLMSNPTLAGTITLEVTFDPDAGTQIRTTQSAALNATAACIQQQLAGVQVRGSAPQRFRIPLTLRQ